MATNTPNLGLRKPDTTDLVNVLTDLNGNYDILDRLPKGELTIKSIVAPVVLGVVGAFTDVAGLVTVAVNFATIPATHRRVKVTLDGMVSSTVANDRLEIAIAETKPAGALTVVQDRVVVCPVAGELFPVSELVRRDIDTVGDWVWRVQMKLRVGTGSIAAQANVAFPFELIVEDIGGF